MNSDTTGFLIYVALAVVASLIAHIFVRRFWVTCAVVAVGCSLLNIAHELVTHDFHIRPSDVAFWLPTLLAYGVAISFPIAFLTGLPFYFYKRRRKRL